MVRNIRLAGQGYYTAKARDALVKPKEAVDRARLQTIAALTLNKLLEPREVRSTRGTRLPGKGRKPKEKCQIPGLSTEESFLLWVTTDAAARSEHCSMIKHQAEGGFSEHFHQTWRNMMGNPKHNAAVSVISTYKRLA